ncbi:Keratin type I cuticular Ha2, partial [Bienertia sinuspersici]
MAVLMEAGTAVILNLSPPPIACIPSRRFPNSFRKSSLFSRTSLTCRTANLRICNVSQQPNQGDFNGSSNGFNIRPTYVLTFAKGLLKFAFSNLLSL